jgi:DNA-binding MarR family transcriptional regulator
MKTPPSGHQTSQSLEVIRALHIVAHQTDEMFDAMLRAKFNLTLARFRILMPLIEIGSITQAEIARFNFQTEASIARQVQFLVSDGYIKRMPDTTDGRKKLLTFTPKTVTLLKTIKATLAGEVEALYQNELTPTELKTLLVLINKLRVAGEKHTAVVFSCPTID